MSQSGKSRIMQEGKGEDQEQSKSNVKATSSWIYFAVLAAALSKKSEVVEKTKEKCMH